MLGFQTINDIFSENAWYFRNALVRANYTNLKKGIYETAEYLEMFLRNLLLNETNELKNRNLHINNKNLKVDIEKEKVDIENQISNKTTAKTFEHIREMFDEYGYDAIFGRSMVSELLGLQNSNVSKILKKLLEEGIIKNVQGYGKGKYKFVKK